MKFVEFVNEVCLDFIGRAIFKENVMSADKFTELTKALLNQ